MLHLISKLSALQSRFRKIKNKLFFRTLAAMLLSFTLACNFSASKEKAAQTEEKDTYLGGELAIQSGMELFNQHCASCHNFMENEVGPNLSGVTSQVDKDWLKDFIRDPKAAINSGDTRAVSLFEKYNLYMPSFPMMDDDDLENLLGFINKFSEAEKRNKSTRTGGLLNPIKEKIPDSDLSLVIEEWLTIPPSSDASPLVRLNKMSAVNTGLKERLFISDLRGKLYEIVNDTVREYLDLNVEEEDFINYPGWGTGLGSFAFHPDFDSNGLLYITHTEPPKSARADFALNDSIKVALQWVLSEWHTKSPAAEKFSGEKRELMRVDMISGAHGFQDITFNPLSKNGDAEYGLLFICIGDGGSALSGYPNLCDNAANVWGSILRIDPAGSDSKNGKYGIPGDNPYVDQSGMLGEVWSSGFRNPHRISWDLNGSGKMLIANIGQHSVEEVNLGKKGADYGWPNREGTFIFDTEANTELVYPMPDDDDDYSYPVIQYDHDEGNAVSGGFVYAGTKIPLLKNKYVFGDITRGTLFFSESTKIIEGQQAPVFKMGLEMNGIATDLHEITQDDRVNLRLGMDSAGELYIFTKSNGKVYKVVGCKNSSL